jgi:RimJ/RimL family protein N-acetyltransferase
MTGNAASIGVSRRLGYQPNGRARVLIRDAPGYEQRFVLDREHWNQYRTVPVEIDGLAPCLPLLGL